MGLIRFLIFALAAWLVFSLVKRFFNQISLSKPKQKKPVAHMVKCDECGVHIPESDAIRVDDRYYCCEEHRDQAEKGK
jgi:uncharacterized protein